MEVNNIFLSLPFSLPASLPTSLPADFFRPFCPLANREILSF